MANFIKFKTNTRFTLVNVEQITFVGRNFEHGIEQFDSSVISFSGDVENYIVVDEPFEEVCDKLTKAEMRCGGMSDREGVTI